MRSHLELGAITWVNANPEDARKHGVDDLVFTTGFDEPESEKVQDFIRATRVNIDELVRLGQDAQRRGCLPNPTERIHELWEGYAVKLLRRVKPGWQAIDGTVQESAGDEAQRYGVGPRWKANSCAMDCVLFCGLMLNAGRTQIDQLTPSLRSQLGEPASVLRRIVGRPWGLMNQAQRMALRDVLRDELANVKSGKFQVADFHDACEVLQLCFNRLPQVSFTDIPGSRCCDAKMVVWGDNRKAERRSGLFLTANGHTESIQTIINHRYRFKPADPGPPCTRADKCTRVMERVNLILDRMPPILLVCLPHNITRGLNKTWRLFDTLELAWHTTQGDQTGRYEPLGCVVMVRGNHYICRWNTAGQIISYDGLARQGRVSNVTDWWVDIPRSTPSALSGIVAMFYRVQ